MATTFDYLKAPPSQLLPDSPQDSIKFQPLPVSRPSDEDEAWGRTLRPVLLSPVVSVAQSIAHSRESSLEQLTQPVSSRPQLPQTRSGVSSAIDKSASYGHHRQTSIVHGIQHSRNGSKASSSPSTLSPQIIATVGIGSNAEKLDMSTDGTTYALSLTGTAVASDQVSELTPPSVDPQRNTEALQSSKSKRKHTHHQSHSSRHPKDDHTKLIGNYALHVLFTTFIARAEEKLNECITVPFNPEPQVESICGQGADPAFDQLILALSHLTRQKPKPLIDVLLLWRKAKSEAASEARTRLNQLRDQQYHITAHKRNAESIPSSVAAGTTESKSPSAASILATKQEFVSHEERRSTVSIFVLCRVFLEVISHTSLAAITPEMEDRLEGLIFGQLKMADTEILVGSPLKLANWNLFAQLMGAMSELSFVSVADRFIFELSQNIQELSLISAKNSSWSASREYEMKLELVLAGMKQLRMQTSPEESWAQSCDFLAALGKLFQAAHGIKTKTAFCHAINMLLLSVAAKAGNAEYEVSKWGDVLNSITPRTARIFAKPRHWAAAFPLTATLLCVSPAEKFSSQWLQLVLPLQTKLKDRFAKPTCLQGIAKVLWTYLYRINEPVPNSIRKLDEVLKLIIPTTSKKLPLLSDPAVAESLIQIIRIVGYRHPEYCFRTIVFPLINGELFLTNKDLKVEQLDPDRIVIGIRAFLAVISDLARGEEGQPGFPQLQNMPSLIERAPPSPAPSSTSTQTVGSSHYLQLGEETSSWPTRISALSDGVREYYFKFCDVLGKITIICDSAFGGQVTLDEKFNSPLPKTPINDTFAFSRREDHQSVLDQKQTFYALLHVAVQALPLCLSVDIPLTSLINLLCTSTSHVESNIASSSAQSLKAIARQSYAQQVTMGFARFIFNFDDRYSAMSEGGMLGAGHIESTLQLYVELLQIWIEEIQQNLKVISTDSLHSTSGDRRRIRFDPTFIWTEVDQIEAHGLFFLGSQSQRVRSFAITVLRLITEFEIALCKNEVREQTSSRFIDILENDSTEVMDFKDEHLSLSVAERSRLQRGKLSHNSRGALVELCSSDVSYDTTLWFKIFPNLIRIANEKCHSTVAICRDLVCGRILQLYKPIVLLSEPSSRGPHPAADPGSARFMPSRPTTQPDILVEQWKLYLIFACSTLYDPGNSQGPVLVGDQHTRKSSRTNAIDKIVSARTLFKYLIPLLSVSSDSVRDAVVSAMGSINMHIYRILLEELQTQVSRCNDDARARIHQRTNSAPRRNRKMDLIRTEITHVYKLTSHFLQEKAVYQDDWILGNLVAYTKDLKLFLMDEEVQMDWQFQKLRRHYCGLVEEVFEGINRTGNPSRWMTFESRKSAFSLMEDWCGFSPNHDQIRVREDTMRQSMMDQQSVGERGTVTAAMEIEKRNLRTAALSAMSILCSGPLSIINESGVTLQFDVRRMLTWIEAIFNSGSDRMIVVGRRALNNLIHHNLEHSYLLEHCIGRCYLTDVPKVLESYLTVVAQVLLEHIDHSGPLWKAFGLCLFMLGNSQQEVRTRSCQVLRALEERQHRDAKVQDFDISVADKTRAVYKLAQLEISKRLSHYYPEVAFHLFSEYASFVKDMQPSSQRNVVATMLPWIQSTELSVDPNGGPTAQSYVLLANLLEITVKSNDSLYNEVQALWQSLATGPHPGNVRLILDFVMSLCLDRREQNFVEYAKQIIVFLSSTNATPGIKVVEFLMLQITPKAMAPNEKRAVLPPPPDFALLPYCADLSELLPIGSKQAALSLGQLSVILLVDLMVAPVLLTREYLPVLLQVVTILWDHHTPLVQEQARAMLVRLIHETVISQLDEATPTARKQAVEDLISLIRKHDRTVVWSYEDNRNIAGPGGNVPSSMVYLTGEIVKSFEMTFPGIKEQWARLSLTWATSCPVRHLACRSFQVFRCILTSMDHVILGEMLARLANTIADEDVEIQMFAMEILMTLKSLTVEIEAERLLAFPQLFWTICACLESTNEREFLEAVDMLHEFMKKADLRQVHVRRMMLDGQLPMWEGPFDGIQPLLYKGLRSSICWETTVKMMEKLIVLPSDSLIGEEKTRVLFTLLANFPRFLNEFDRPEFDEEMVRTAIRLASTCDGRGLTAIALVLVQYGSGTTYRNGNEFLLLLFGALRDAFLPDLAFEMVTFCMGLLTNAIPWVKIQTMKILCVAIPAVDLKTAKFASHGTDLITPLLRLLQSEYCMEAIDVLDNLKPLFGNSTDRRLMRLSLSRPTSRAIRKEYERTESLFGIPDASGWAIPMPAKKSDSTRMNIHAAFHMCQRADGGVVDATPTPEVSFQTEELPYSYLEAPDWMETMMSDDARSMGNVGDLVTKLDSLDDFFDDPTEEEGQFVEDDGRSSRTVTEYSPDSFDSGARLYDEQILPLLHQASNNYSFQNELTDRPAGVPSREASMTMMTMMNRRGLGTLAPPRRGLLTRSVTMPGGSSISSVESEPEGTSDDEFSEGILSDGDDERPRTMSNQGSSFIENMIRPFAQSTRLGMRRFTTSRSRDGDKQRSALPILQRMPVPNLPLVYATKPTG